MRTFLLSNLVVMSSLVVACNAAPGAIDADALSEEGYTRGATQDDLEESADPGRSLGEGGVDLSINEEPCGENTIAVITDERAATYAFCSSPSAEGGALVFELLPSDSHESLLDQENDAAALLARIMPAGQEAPAWVTESVRLGARVGDESPFVAHAMPPTSNFVATACADPDAAFDEAWLSEFPNFYDEFVYFGGAGSAYTIRDCVREHMFFHEAVPSSQRTASGYTHTENGACAGYARVYSCDGYTLLEALTREGTSGDWNDYFSFWVPAGGLGKVKVYANAQQSCHPTRDKDDIRFLAESSPGAYHHFLATFIGRTDTVGNALICNTDPV